MVNSSQHGSKLSLLDKLGFKNNTQLAGFFTVVFSGQIIYSGFEAFKGTFYNQLLQVLHVNNAQLGVMFSLIGISVFFYVPGGWINNRFSIKSILTTGLLIRMFSMFVIIFFQPSFQILRILAIIWGLTDSFFWPAVLNGVTLMSDSKHRGMAFGLLESTRRALEMIMNLLLVGAMAFLGGLSIFKTGMLIYNLLIIPLVIAIIKFVPNNGISAQKNLSETQKSGEAFKGLIKILLMPKVWLASITALTIYWSYIILIYSVPYLQAIYHITSTETSLFGILNTGAVGVLAGVISGSLSDFVFKSSSKMMFTALLITFLSLLLIRIIPNQQSMLTISIILLIIFSFAIFLAKSIILAPLTEIGISDKYSGSAMSVGSFVAYAPVFWVYSLNGSIIDHNNSVQAYQHIFSIGTTVAAIGVITSFILIFATRNKAPQ